MPTPPPRGRLEWLRLVPLGVIVLLAMVSPSVALSIGPDPQDACRIGAVSPEEYPGDRNRDRRPARRRLAGDPWRPAWRARGSRERRRCGNSGSHPRRHRSAREQRSEGRRDARGPALDRRRVRLGRSHPHVHAPLLSACPRRCLPLGNSMSTGSACSGRCSGGGRINVNFYADKSWETISELRRVTFHIAVPFLAVDLGSEGEPSPDTCLPAGTGGGGAPRTSPGAPAGNATPLPEQPPSRETLPRGTLEPLDDHALRRALYGNCVGRDMTGVYDAGGLEFFSGNGGWGELGGRAAFGGRFSISNGVVCVDRRPGTTCCRRFYVNSSGQHFYLLKSASRHAGCYHYIVPEADMSSLVPVGIFREEPDHDPGR